jgi:hypothetical protein
MDRSRIFAIALKTRKFEKGTIGRLLRPLVLERVLDLLDMLEHVPKKLTDFFDKKML